MKSFFKDLPPLIRGIIILVILAVIIFALWKIYQRIQREAKLREQKKTQDAIKKDLENELASGGTLSLIDSEYRNMSDELQTAFSGCGTDDTVVALVLDKISTNADMLKLIDVYGIRKYEGCNLFGVGESDKESSLLVALSEELGFFQKTLQNKNFENKGIKFRID